MEVHYPVFGIAALDAAMVQWAKDIAAAFEEDAATLEILENGQKSELEASYTVSTPSSKAVSVTYTVSSYTAGAAHGFLEIVTRSYDFQTGAPLALTDIFGDAPGALRLLSEYARVELQRQLGEEGDPEWIAKGTEPSINNFSSMALTPQGLHVYIQPYQVGPWAIGPQAVDVPLDALHDAQPKVEFWGGTAE